jgi:hypothetical protein
MMGRPKTYEDELVEEMEDRLRGHKDDLPAGTRVVIVLDDVIPVGTRGTVSRDYVVSKNESLTVLVDKCERGDGWKNSGKSIWHLNRFQVSKVEER